MTPALHDAAYSAVVRLARRDAVDGVFTATLAEWRSDLGFSNHIIRRVLSTLQREGAVILERKGERNRQPIYRFSDGIIEQPAPALSVQADRGGRPNLQTSRMEREAIRRLSESFIRTPPADQIRLVPPGSHPARGFSMLSGRIR